MALLTMDEQIKKKTKKQSVFTIKAVGFGMRTCVVYTTVACGAHFNKSAIRYGVVPFYYGTVREGPAASTNLMARCQILHVNMVYNPFLYCTVAYGTVALNLSTR
jgi:hypothetical protein